MVRKRLSDLLREEGKKPAEGSTSGEVGEIAQVKPLDQPSSETPDSQAPDSETSDSSEAPVDEAIEVRAVVQQAEPAARPPAAPQPAAPQIAAPQIAAPQIEITQLETTVLQLKQDITAAQQLTQAAEAAFNQQLAKLQATIADRESSIQQLTAEAQSAQQQANQQVTQLKAELETARQTILQLSQVNPPAKALSTPARPGFLSRSQPPVMPSPAVLPSPRAAEPELEPSRSQMIISGRATQRATQPVPERSSRHELELHKVLDHPTQPGSLPPMSSEPKPTPTETIKLSDTDVGWMD